MQYSNEIHIIIWTRCLQTFCVSVNSEILHYDKGSCGTSNVLSYFKIRNGYYMEQGHIKKNKISIRKMNIKTSDSLKKIRKKSELLRQSE